MLAFGKIQLRVQHFEVEKLDKMLEIEKPTSCSTFQPKKLSIELRIGQKPTPCSTIKGKKLNIELNIEWENGSSA